MRIIDKNKKIKYVIFLIMGIGVCIYYIYSQKSEYIQVNYNINDFSQSEEKYLTQNVLEEKDKIIVYVAGEVVNPGIYEMNESDRISDAIDKAGGLKEEAYIKNLNLAQYIEDGMKIYVYNVNECVDTVINHIEENNNINKVQNSKININTATQTQLETLPGIGTATALKIINYREENGKFKNVEDIKNVDGIGESKFSKIKSMICIQ